MWKYRKPYIKVYIRLSFKSHKETMYILLEMQRLFGPIEQRSQKDKKKSEKEKNYE